MTLGQKIKKLRTEKGLTQKDLSDQLHVTFQTISKWESDTNEPDITTLKELAKFYGCSVDYLINESDEELKEQDSDEFEIITAVPKEEAVTKTIIVHQKELHVCERCKKDIPEGDLVMEDICVRPGGRGHSAEYRKAYYHKHCLEELNKERAEQKRRQRAAHCSSAKKKCFGWGIAAGVTALGIALAVFLTHTDVVHPALGVLYSVLIAYGIFAMIYCILSGSYIGDVFVWCASLSIKFPGLIFSWDLEGFAWLIAMKILFAVLGFLIGVLALLFAIVLSAALGGFSFPFILIHNIRTDYEDAF